MLMLSLCRVLGFVTIHTECWSYNTTGSKSFQSRIRNSSHFINIWPCGNLWLGFEFVSISRVILQTINLQLCENLEIIHEIQM